MPTPSVDAAGTPLVDRLPDELWESIVAVLPDADWARARATCRRWRDFADAPHLLAARLARPGHGWRPPLFCAAQDRREMVAELARRARLAKAADRRHFSYALRPPGPGDGEVLPLFGPRLMVRGVSGDVRVEFLGGAAPPMVQRTLHRNGISELVTAHASFLIFRGPTFWVWTHAAAITVPLGALTRADVPTVDLALTASGSCGAMVLSCGDVVVGNACRDDQVRWCPWPGPAPRTRRPRAQAIALVGEGALAAVLGDGGELSLWRVDHRDLDAPWWEVCLPSPAPGTWQGGRLVATGDGRYLLAGPSWPEDVAAEPALSAGPLPPTVVALDAQGRPAGAPLAVPLASDERLRDPTTTPSGGYLYGAVAGPWGEEARRWALSAPSGGNLPLKATSFARGGHPIANLALSDDGALGAVVAPPPGAAGRVVLWRLDGDAGPARVWAFKPGHVFYRRVAFLGPTDDLVLMPAAGGAIVVWRVPPAGAAERPADGLAVPGAVYFGGEDHNSHLIPGDHLWLFSHLR